jgi:hypothetical protein
MEKAIKRIQKNIKNSFLVLLSLIAISSPSFVLAANLNISPRSGSYGKNTTFAVSINVSSPEVAMNAASATISFPTDKLQVASVSKSGSIVDFWAQEPNFSNGTGQIKMEGVVLTPGYKGSSGKLLTINFRGKETGLAEIKIISSSVLANDGIGTNILKGVSNASFTIKEVPVEEPEVIKIDDLKPIEESVAKEEVCEPDSIITSSSHPGVVWRRENSASFSWDLPEGTLASKIAFDRNPNTEPTTINSPAIVEKRYENLEDGIWYFHLSLQDNSGWSETENFKIKIDHTPPSIEAREVFRKDLTDPKPVIELKINDKTSCVKNFELSINGELLDYERLPDGNIKLETLPPGEHELVISAYDRAGNKNEKFLPIIVESIPVPEVTSYPAEIMTGETLVIKGETIPNGNVEAKIWGRRNNFLIREEFQSASGRFTFERDNLRKGIIFVSFKVTDSRGAESNWSKPVEIKVKSDSLIDINNMIDKLGLPITAGLGLLIVVIIILITRSLTIRKIRRDLGL